MGILGFERKRDLPSPKSPASPAVAADDPAALKPAASRHAPGTEIGYHPDLIARFRKAHEALQRLYVSMKNQVEQGDFATARKTLDAFQKALTGHMLEENVLLYTYLAKCLASDPDSRELMKSMKVEMGKIGSTAAGFVKEYADSGITPFNKRQFLEGWDKIGAVLTDRIEREETSLYTMYMPPDAFQSEDASSG